MGFTLETGKRAPDFKLPGVDGESYSLADFKDTKLLVVLFSCNHCPYVVGSEDRIIRFVRDYTSRGLSLVAINSNQEKDYSEDNFQAMVQRSKEKKFPFPYLRDLSQDVAKAYGAIKTPHFFLFDENRILQYNGRMDDSPMDPARVKTHELGDAVEALLFGNVAPVPVTESVGCTVKWIGHDSHWIPTDICDFV